MADKHPQPQIHCEKCGARLPLAVACYSCTADRLFAPIDPIANLFIKMLGRFGL